MYKEKVALFGCWCWHFCNSRQPGRSGHVISARKLEKGNMKAALCFVFFALSVAQLVIQTEYGAVRGALSSSSVRAWRGVPYASPPVGKLRFAAPVPPTPWAPNTLDCTQDHGHVCPQLESVAGFVIGEEDCLYMDIYSPTNAGPNAKLPVMVWFYGGAYVFGM